MEPLRKLRVLCLNGKSVRVCMPTDTSLLYVCLCVCVCVCVCVCASYTNACVSALTLCVYMLWHHDSFPTYSKVTLIRLICK
jgi:hypothetical protein